MLGQTSVVADIFKSDAHNMYNENWDGCRDLWKENYRRMKLRRFYTDRPIVPPDPDILEFEREYRRSGNLSQQYSNARSGPIRLMSCQRKNFSMRP